MPIRLIPLKFTLAASLPTSASVLLAPLSQLTFMGQLTVGDTIYVQFSRPGAVEIMEHTVAMLPAPDAQGNVPLQVVRGRLGTVAAAWGRDACAVEAHHEFIECAVCPFPDITALVNQLIAAHPCCQPCPVPTVVSTLTPVAATVGQIFLGTVTLGNTTAVDVTGLPSWATATFVPSTGVLTITGTAATAGAFPLMLDLTNQCSNGKVAYTLGAAGGSINSVAAPVTTLCPEPALAVTLAPSAVTAGQPYNGTFTLTNATAASLGAGTPAWMTGSYNATTGVMTVTGTAPNSGSINSVTFNATNAPAGCISNGSTGGFAGLLTVASTPVVPCPAPVVLVNLTPTTVVAGQPYTGIVRVDNFTSVAFTNLPAWATATPNYSAGVVTITGTPPAAAATLALTANFNNSCGALNTPLNGASLGSLTVTAAPVATQCPEPQLTSGLNPAQVQQGAAYVGTFTVSNATNVVMVSKPSWLAASFNAGSGVMTLTGTAPAADSVSGLTFNATNACAGAISNALLGGDAGELAVIAGTVCPAPVVTAALAPATAVVGTAYTGTLTVSPATLATVTNLPVWAAQSFNPGTGVLTISGTPNGSATLNLQVDATNACAGANASAATALGGGGLAVSAVPACPTPSVVSQLAPSTVQIGAPYTGTISVGNATAATVSGLPGWAAATFDAGAQSITITGTPSAAGTFNLTVSLTNACPGGTASTVAGAVAGTLVASAAPVCPSPVILVPLAPATATGGVAYSGQVVLQDTTAVNVTNLPAWATATFNVGAGLLTISGTPPFGQVVPLTATLTNACVGGDPTVLLGQALGVLSVPCQTPSIVTGLSPVTATAGAAYTGTVTFANATGVTMSGMPLWMSATFNASTQVLTLTGTPTASGAVTTVAATAENVCGSGPTATTPSTGLGSITVSNPAAPVMGAPNGNSDTASCAITSYTPNWTAVAGATGYEVEWFTNAPTCTASQQPWGGTATVGPGQLSVDIIALGAGGYPPYDFCDDGINPVVQVGPLGQVRVRAIGSWGTTAWATPNGFVEAPVNCSPQP